MRCHVIVQHRRRTDHIVLILEQIPWHLRIPANRNLERTATTLANQRVFGFHRLRNTLQPLSSGLQTYLRQHAQQQILEIATMNIHSASLLVCLSLEYRTTLFHLLPARPSTRLCPVPALSKQHFRSLSFEQRAHVLQIAYLVTHVHCPNAKHPPLSLEAT